MADSRTAATVATGILIASNPITGATDKAQQAPIESKAGAKQYSEMNAYVHLFKQLTSGQIKQDLDPYEFWDLDSNTKDSRFWALMDNLNIVSGVSKIKTVSPQMRKECPHNPFSHMIDSYLNRHKLVDNGIALPTIKKLSKFILEGMQYVFLRIEIDFKADTQQRIIHYKVMRNLCLDLISHEKWSIDYNSWKNLFLNDHGTDFSLFIHKLILQLNAKIQTTSIEAKPDELKEYISSLDTHLKNTLATSKEMLLKLISDEEIPKDLFHDETVVNAFKKQDYNYFSKSTTIPQDIKEFVGNSGRFQFIRDQFISPQHEATLERVNALAAISAKQSIHQRQLINHTEPLLLQEQATEEKKREQESEHKEAVSIVTSSASSMALTKPVTISEQKAIQKLKDEYIDFLDNKNKSFYLRIQDTVPSEIKEALISRSSNDSVIQAKHYKAKALILIINDLCSIIHQLEKDVSLSSNIKKFVDRAGIVSEWFIDADFQTLAEDLKILSAEINTTYLDLVEKCLSLRSEMQTLNRSQWSLNVNLLLTDVHTILDDVNEINTLLFKIKKAMSWTKKYNDFMDMMTYKRRITLQQEVFFGIEHSKSLFEEVFEQLIRLTYESAQIQRNLSLPGKQENRFYLDQALQSRQTLMPPSTVLTIEEIDDEVELTLEDFEQALLSRHHLKLSQALAGKIVEEDKKFHLEVLANQKTRHIPLSLSAKIWLEEKQKPRTINLVQESQSNLPQQSQIIPLAPPVDHNREQSVAKRKKIVMLSQHNKFLHLEVKNIALEQSLKDRRQDFSFRIFKPTWWWLTGVGLFIHATLAFGAAIYRLVNYKSIKHDLADYACLETEKQKKLSAINESNAEIATLKSELESIRQQNLSEQKIISTEDASRERKPATVTNTATALSSQSFFAATANSNSQGPLASTEQTNAQNTEEIKQNNTSKRADFSEAELKAMSADNAQALACKLIAFLSKAIIEKLKNYKGNLTQELIIEFDKAFKKLAEHTTVTHPQARLVIYQQVLNNFNDPSLQPAKRGHKR